MEEEERDLAELKVLASEATVIEFDGKGRVVCPSFLPTGTFDLIDGLVKVRLPEATWQDLHKIHDYIKSQVNGKMVSWAGTEQDSTRLRAFGFLREDALEYLCKCGVKLHAPEKVGTDAMVDEEANHRAHCILHEQPWKDLATSTTRNVIQVLQESMKDHIEDDDEEDNGSACLSVEELIAFQPNLHNGAEHLAAHLDYPLHEGFGKIIVTVAIRGGATILLIGGGGGDDDSDDQQPVWRFHLNEGECYVLSGNVRNRCLHAVLADVDGNNQKHPLVDRESLNLRFGIHTKEQANNQVLQYWPNEL